MNSTLEKLSDIKQNGYQIDFEKVLNNAFNNYKKIALYAGLVLLIFSILFVVFITIALVSIMGVTAMTHELTPEKLKLENLSQSSILIIGVVSMVTSCIFSPFQAAFLKMADHGKQDKEFLISNLFSYYKFPYLIEIVVSTLLITTFNLAQSTLMTFVHLDILGAIITYFISFVTFLTIPFIIFGELKAIDAIKYSALIITKQPIIILGLIIVSIIGAFIGIMGCCIGIFFTLPIIYSMTYSIYDAIIGVDYLKEED